MAAKPPGSTCLVTNQSTVQDGTMCRMPSPLPGPTGSVLVQAPNVIQTEDIRAAANSAAGIVGQLTYDSFVRTYIYDPAAKAFSQQGEEFVRKGLLSRAKAAEWVNAQRNALLKSVRQENNSPLGRAISEYLKPSDKLPMVSDLVAKNTLKMPNATTEEVLDAVIRGGAKTRGSVNKLAFTFRWAGPVLIAVNIGFSAYLIAEVPPETVRRVAAHEAGGLIGGTAGGIEGAEAGCSAGAVVGVWFEGVGAAPGCLVGGFIGAFGGGYAGSKVGSWWAVTVFDFTNTAVEWVETD